jgi:hypothetical protein
MALSLEEIRRIIADMAHRHHPDVEVIAVTTTEESAGYGEVILMIRDQPGQPRQVILGVNRDASEPEFRAAVGPRLQRHLSSRRLPDAR